MYNAVVDLCFWKGWIGMKSKLLCVVLLIVCIMTGCSTNKEDPAVAFVGKDKITVSEFNFYLNSVKEQMKGTELSTDEDWQTKEIDGKKAIDVAKEQAMKVAFDNLSYIQIYEKMGNKFDSDVKKSIKEVKDSIVKQYENNGGYEAFLKTAEITDGFVDMLCKSMYASDYLFNEAGKDFEATEQQINDYIKENPAITQGYRTAKHVLILTKDMNTDTPYDDAKKAEAKQKAEEILKRAQSGEDFDALVVAFSEDPGSVSNPDGYTFGDGEMVEEFTACVDSLKPGEIGFCESTFGYHIIKRLDVNMNYFKETVENSLKYDVFEDFVDNKREEYKIFVEVSDGINEIK